MPMSDFSANFLAGQQFVNNAMPSYEVQMKQQQLQKQQQDENAALQAYNASVADTKNQLQDSTDAPVNALIPGAPAQETKAPDSPYTRPARSPAEAEALMTMRKDGITTFMTQMKEPLKQAYDEKNTKALSAYADEYDKMAVRYGSPELKAIAKVMRTTEFKDDGAWHFGNLGDKAFNSLMQHDAAKNGLPASSVPSSGTVWIKLGHNDNDEMTITDTKDYRPEGKEAADKKASPMQEITLPNGQKSTGQYHADGTWHPVAGTTTGKATAFSIAYESALEQIQADPQKTNLTDAQRHEEALKKAERETHPSSRVVSVIDRDSGEAVEVTGDDITANPGKYAGAAVGQKAMAQGATITDIRGAIKNVRSAVDSLPTMDATQTAKVAEVLKERDPKSAMSSFFKAQWTESLSNEQRNYVIGVLQLREIAMGQRSLMGVGGQGKDIRDAFLQNVPGADTSKETVNKQLDAMSGVIDRIEPGIVKVRRGSDEGSKAPAKADWVTSRINANMRANPGASRDDIRKALEQQYDKLTQGQQ